MMKAIVLRAAGTNCDYELGFGLEKAGFTVENMHISELISKKKKLSDYSLLAIPGGFSAGDYLGSGKVFANKILYKLKNSVPEFIENGGLAIGVCNGFQVLVKAGILPGFNGNYNEQLCTLTLNEPSGFQCGWVKIRAEKSKSVFTPGISEMDVPIAHGEGRFMVCDDSVLQKLKENGQVAFRYSGLNPNGSLDDIAGICDETGRVLGLMPHPERNLFGLNAPDSDQKEMPEEGAGMQMFRNAAEFFR